ncbi:MAG TPA: hypothetical protein VK636_20085 [Gemmatimonadaceae bacterium]|nr:hypothetical protein [Gemmatimonadaceae bacterium]
MHDVSPLSDSILIFALTFALYRVGDIWSFQVVLFPLWGMVSAQDFPAYHNAHFRSIFGVIFVPMGLSLLSAIFLWFFPPPGAPVWLLGAALALQAVLLLSLIFWIPFQQRIAREGNRPELIRRLVVIHWTRVANITLFALVVLRLLWIRLQG